MNKYIIDFVKENGINKETYEANTSKLLDCEKSLNLCRECKGLYECRQKSIGERIGLKYDDIILETIELCDYKKDEIQLNNTKNSYVYSDIPDLYYDVSLKNIPAEDDAIKKYLAKALDIYKNKPSKGLYVVGNMGVGKTYMMIALANSLVNEGKNVAFIKAANFINDMRRLVASNNDEYNSIINGLKKCDYLFIDDIGSESVSTFSRDDVFFIILDYRMENKLLTCFTSNFDKKALLEHYSFLKNGKAETMQAQRLLERIDILSETFVLNGKNRRRQS